MLTEEELKQIAQVMSEQLKPINEKLDKVDERLDALEESMEIIKYSTNELVRWVDTNFRHQYPFPVDRDIS